MTFFRLFLGIPAVLVAAALSGALVVVGFLGWFASLVTGRMPTGLRDLGAVCVRYLAQTSAYWAAPHRPLPRRVSSARGRRRSLSRSRSLPRGYVWPDADAR